MLTDDFAVIISFLPIQAVRQRKALADSCLDRRGCCRGQVSKLVRKADDQGTKHGWAQFDQVDLSTISVEFFRASGVLTGIEPQTPPTKNCSKNTVAINLSFLMRI